MRKRLGQVWSIFHGRFSGQRGFVTAAKIFALLFPALLVSCGGAVVNNDSVPTVSVTVSPPTASVGVNGTVQLTAAVQNSSSPVIWQINSTPGGNSTLGTIPLTGTSITYQAPASVPNPSTLTVTAVLESNSSVSGSAIITVLPAPAPTITVSPSSAQVSTGGTVAFSASVQNSDPNSSVLWEVNNIGGGTRTLGTIVAQSPSTMALYTAPASVPATGSVTVTAVLQSDLVTAGSATVVITEPPAPVPSVSVSPSTPTISPGGSQQFTAAVQNSTASVTWEIGSGGVGTLTPSQSAPFSAIYTAPAAALISALPLSFTIEAVLSDGSAAGSANVTISTFTGVYSWRNDSSLTGQNPAETSLFPESIAANSFGKLLACPVDGYVYAQPLYVPDVALPNLGVHNVIFVATEHDSVFAIDADTCQMLWQTSFLGDGVTTVPSTDLQGTTDITPEIGITGTPVIDSASGTLYVVAKTKENITSGTGFTYVQRLHALDITTGDEKFDGPRVIESGPSAVAFDPLNENQRPALQLAGGNVYVAFGSYISAPLSVGQLFAYDVATLNLVAEFDTTPLDGDGGGIGQTGAAPSVDASGNLYVATGVGSFNPGGGAFAQTLLALPANLAPAAYTNTTWWFTPSLEGSLSAFGEDFGSGGVLLLPDQAVAIPHLGLIGDAAGKIYLVNRDNLGGNTPAPGADHVVQEFFVSANGVFSTPAYFAGNDTIYIAAAGDSLKAFPLTGGTLSTQPSLQSVQTFGVANLVGSSPVISSNASDATTEIIWVLDTSGFGGGSFAAQPAILYAYDTNLNLLYSSSPTAGAPDAAGLAVKYAVPTVANGKVYIGTQGEISVYGLLP